jgi:hypothetical protein
MIVKMTQFLRPNGRQVAVTCEGVDNNLQKNYDEIVARKMRVTCEELRTGKVSLALEHEQGDFDMELCDNAPDVPKQALERLLGRFTAANFEKWLEEQDPIASFGDVPVDEGEGEGEDEK